MKNDVIRYNTTGDVFFFCPGCGNAHKVQVGEEQTPRWEWNGSLVKPRFSPSVRVQSGNESGPTVCHSYVRDGVIEFLSDCTHALAGKNVSLEPFGDN